MNRILAWFLVALIFAMSGPLQAATMASARGFEKSLYGRSAAWADKYAYCSGDPIGKSDPDGLEEIYPTGVISEELKAFRKEYNWPNATNGLMHNQIEWENNPWNENTLHILRGRAVVGGGIRSGRPKIGAYRAGVWKPFNGGGYWSASAREARPMGVPSSWTSAASKKNGGMLWSNPANPGDSVRVMPANSNSPWPTSRVNYVRWQRNGHPLDVNGNKLADKFNPDAHIPTEHFWFPNYPDK